MIEKVNLLNLGVVAENEKGTTFAANTQNRDDFLIVKRKAGTRNGCHFHKGQVNSKNPEILFVIEGKAELYAYDLKNGEEGKSTITTGFYLEIFPFVWHELNVLSDITFLEMNSIEAHKSDTFYNVENLDLNQ